VRTFRGLLSRQRRQPREPWRPVSKSGDPCARGVSRRGRRGDPQRSRLRRLPPRVRRAWRTSRAFSQRSTAAVPLVGSDNAQPSSLALWAWCEVAADSAAPRAVCFRGTAIGRIIFRLLQGVCTDRRQHGTFPRRVPRLRQCLLWGHGRKAPANRPHCAIGAPTPTSSRRSERSARRRPRVMERHRLSRPGATAVYSMSVSNHSNVHSRSRFASRLRGRKSCGTHLLRECRTLVRRGPRGARGSSRTAPIGATGVVPP